MKIQIRNQPHFYAGLLFAAAGLAFTFVASGYNLGTARSMGPGYFPTMLGALLAILGAVIALRSLGRSAPVEKVPTLHLRPLLLVVGTPLLFALLLRPMGLVVASLVLVVGSAVASHEFHWRYAVLTWIVLVVGSYLVFIYGLRLPMPMWPRGF